MTRDDAIRILDELDAAGLEYAPVMDKATVDVWAQQMRDINADLGLEAVGRWVASNEAFPAPAAIIKLAKAIKLEQHKQALPAQGERAGYRCKCQDVGMVEVQGQRDAWRPCKDCNWEGFARWEAGDYETKVFRAVLEPVDPVSAAKHLAKAREVLAAAQQTKRPRSAA